MADEIKFVSGDEFLVLRERGEAVVLLKTSKVVWYNERRDFARWLLEKGKQRSEAELNEAEFDTYACLCNLEQVHIQRFPEWATRHDSNFNPISRTARQRDTSRTAGKGFSGGNFWRWLLGLPV